MITDRTLARLRTSASMVLVTPGLSVAVDVEGEPVVEARRPPFPDGAEERRIIPVCAFHRCVGRAHELRRQGSRVEMVGVEGDLEPTVTVHGGAGIQVLPTGIVRRTVDASWWHLNALSLPVDAVAPVAHEVSERTGVAITLHADRVLDVTVTVTEGPARDRAAAFEAIDALEHVAAVATVEAMVAVLEADTDWDAVVAAEAAIHAD